MGSITHSFDNAFERMYDQRWDKIYVLVDIHDTIFESDYSDTHSYVWLGNSKKALQMLSERDDICLILWSGTHMSKLSGYLSEFMNNGVVFEYINENPEVEDTKTYCSDKIYFNVGIDDKFGFDPNTDWDEIIDFLNNNKKR